MKWVDKRTKAQPAVSVSVTPRLKKVVKAGAVGSVVLAALAVAYTVSTWSASTGLTSIGKAYPGHLGKAYAAAWEDGAKLLDSGQSVAMALDQVKTSWEANRGATFSKYVQPAFASIIPEGMDEKEILPGERQELAQAWREFAKGLKQ